MAVKPPLWRKELTPYRFVNPNPHDPHTEDGQPLLNFGERILLRRMVDEGCTVIAAARATNTPRITAYEWIRKARVRFGAATIKDLLRIVIERGLLEEDS